MPQATNTVRLFVSSTFGDFKDERNALHDHVFPRLREFCSRHGARFQAIDLRWGISAEAGLDQQTMQICVEEIARCQRLSLKPNFMVLLGDRFGWVPLPGAIPVDEFEALARVVTDQDHRTLLDTWYQRDDNALPPAMVLQPRRGEYAQDRDRWKEVEERLHRALTDASRQITLTDEARVKYEMSATGQEIVSGALAPQEAGASEHVFGFFRCIDNLPKYEGTSQGGVFTDLDANGARDENAKAALTALKASLRENLPENNILEYHCELNEQGISTGHLDQLCDDVYRQLSGVIGAQLSSQQEVSRLDGEVSDHDAFARERATGFIGRVAAREAIREYLDGDTRVPLVIHGESGSGKSALMAYASELARSRPGSILIRRFIGVTPVSSTSLGLLKSLLEQVNRIYDATRSLPTEPRELLESIPMILGQATAEQPLLIFLDALDQLTASRDLALSDWMPAELPAHVHLVVSTTESDRLLELRRCVPDARYHALASMPTEDGLQILNAWLAAASRCLTAKQQQQVLDGFAVNGLPLYLKLAFERARHWQSFDAAHTLADDVRGLVRMLIDELSRENNHGELFVDRVLDYLAAARHGLTEDELLDVLSRDREVLADFQRRAYQTPVAHELPVVVWSRLHGDLAPYLVERDADGARVLGFFHRQFMELAVEESLEAEEIPQRAASLADYFASQPNFLDVERARPNGRKLAELPYHLIRAGRWQQLEDTLMDFDFCMARCHMNESDDLVGYFRDALRAIPQPSDAFRLWESFIRERAHILRRGDERWPAHKILLQLAVEHADDSPVTIKAEAWLEQSHCDWRWLRNPQRVAHVGSDPCLHVFEGHTEFITNCTIISDSRILSESKNTLRLWSSEGKLIQKYDKPSNQINGPTTLTFDKFTDSITIKPDPIPDGLTLSRSSRGPNRIMLSNGRILSWDSTEGTNDYTLCLSDEEGQPLGELSGHWHRVLGATELFDGRILSWSSDYTLRLWSSEGQPLGKPLTGHKYAVIGAKVLSDGQILSWSSDNTLRLWGSDGEPLGKPFTGHTGWINGVKVLPDGRILSWSNDFTLRLWDIKGKPLCELAGHTAEVNGATVLPDGRILSWSNDFTLRLWDIKGKPLCELAGHTGAIYDAMVLSDGHILSMSTDHSLRLWSSECKPIEKLAAHSGRINGTATLPDGRILSWSTDSTLRLWGSKGQALGKPLIGHSDRVVEAVVLTDGRILSWSEDATLRLWGSDGNPLGKLSGHTCQVVGATELFDDRILSWSNDNTLRLWDIKGKPLCELSGHTAEVSGATVLPDGRFLSWSEDATLRLWSSDGNPLGKLSGHTCQVVGATVLPDGRILSWSNDFTLRLWDSEGKQLAVLFVGKTQTTYIRIGAIGLKAMPDGCILSWSREGHLRLWGNDGKPLCELAGHTGAIYDAMVLSDGHILSWSEDETLRLWDSSLREQIDICLLSDAFYHRPDWLSAMRPSLESSDRNFLAYGAENFCMFKNRTEESNQYAQWHSSHRVHVHLVFDDGTTVVSLSSGHVFCLESIE